MKLLVFVFLISGIVSIFFSKSKKRYEKLVIENDKDFADKNVRTLRRCGYTLIALSSLCYLFVLI